MIRLLFVFVLLAVAGLAKPSSFHRWSNRPDIGDAKTKFNLGWMYENGKGGVTKDEAEAVEWYRLAAEQGHAQAQLNLGILYDNGLGVKQDYAEAIRWYRQAAAQGNAQAQFKPGGMYDNG